MTQLVNIGTAANDGTGTPLRTAFQSINKRLEGQVSLKEFGALGSGSADDTAAVQAFFDSVTTYGLRGFIPSGQYNIRAPIVIALNGPGWTVEGAGVESAIFTVDNSFTASAPAIQLVSDDLDGSAVDFPGFNLGNFSIRAAGSGFDGNATAGLQIGTDSTAIAKATGYQLRNVHDILIANFPVNMKLVHTRMITFRNLGLYTDETPNTNLLITQNGLSTGDFIFENCQFVNNANLPGNTNVLINSPVGPYDIANGNKSISGINFKSCDLYGGETAVKLLAQNSSWMTEIWFEDGCQIDQAVTYGYTIEANGSGTLIENVHITDGWMNFTGGYGISLAGTGGPGAPGQVKNIRIDKNTFYRNSTAAITTFGFEQSVNNINITDNIFSDCDSVGGAIVLNNIFGANVTGNVARKDGLFSQQPKYLVEIVGTTDSYVVTGNRGIVGQDVETAVISDTATGTNKVVRGNVGSVDAQTAGTAAEVMYSPASAGSVDVTVESKLREFVSVKDFGAVGDGVADDTAALINAFNRGGRVSVPRGAYLIAAASGGVVSTLNKSIEVICEGGARFFTDALDNELIRFNIDSAAVEAGESISFKWTGGKFDISNSRVSTSVPFSAEYPPDPAKQGLADVTDALYIQGSYTVGDGYVDGITHASVDGVVIYGGDHWQNAGGDSGIYIQGANVMSVTRSVFEGLRDCGVYLSQSIDGTTQGRIDVESNYFINCCHGVAIKRGPSGFAIDRNTFIGCARAILVEQLIGNAPKNGFITNNAATGCGPFAKIYAGSNITVSDNAMDNSGAFIADGVTIVAEGVFGGIILHGSSYCTVKHNRSLGLNAAHLNSSAYFIKTALNGATLCQQNLFERNYSGGWYGVALESTGTGAYNQWDKNYAINSTLVGVSTASATSAVVETSVVDFRPVYPTGIRYGNGSAAAPVIARNSDITTGIYFGPGGLVSLSSAGSQGLFSSSTGCGTAKSFTPAVDNTLQLGSASLRFSAVYAGKGSFTALQTFADNTAAAALAVGDVYSTPTGQLMVRY